MDLYLLLKGCSIIVSALFTTIIGKRSSGNTKKSLADAQDDKIGTFATSADSEKLS